MFNQQEVLKQLFKDPEIAEQFGGLFNNFSQQRKQGNQLGGALDLSRYSVNPFMGYADGGVVGNGRGNPGDGTSPGEQIVNDLGLDLNTYRKYRDLVIYHETGGTFNTKQKQKGGGPGRGLFQFEKESAETAAERLKTYYQTRGLSAPKFLDNVSDVGSLSKEQQEILFAGQMMTKIKKSDDTYDVKLDSAFRRKNWGKEDFSDAWIKNHNRTKGDEREERIEKFNTDFDAIFEQAGSMMKFEPNIIPFASEEAMNRDKQFLEFIPGLQEEVPEAFLGKMFKGIGKGVKNFVKQPLKFAGNAVKGFADGTLSMIGAGDVIQNSWVDNSKFLTGYTNIGGKVARTALDIAVPGAGTALGAIGGALNSGVNEGRANKQAKDQQNQFNNSASGGLQELMGILGGGFSGQGMGMNQSNPMDFLSQLFGGQFENGGIINSIPEGLEGIQTEKYRGKAEKIILPDLMIADVNAKTSHEKMEDGHITDVVPAGTYIASARPEMAFKRKDLEQIIFGYESLPYSEHAKGTIPKKITAADIIPKGKKKLLPAEYAQLIQDKFKVVDRDDFFTNAANNENLNSRVPYAEILVALGESKRKEIESPVFKYGGYVGPRKANAGLISGIGAAAGVAGGVLTGIGQIANINAQKRALEAQQRELSALTGRLEANNQASVAAGIAGQLAQQTTLPDLRLDYSRLENFNTNTPQSFIDDAARPTMDVISLIDRLGDRGGLSVLANTSAQSMLARNAAAQQAFAQKQSYDYNIASSITEGRNFESQYNNNLRQQEVAARNNVFNNIAGQIQGGLQNTNDIQTQAFNANTNFALQRAGLVGQGTAAIGNTLAGIGGTLNSGSADLSSLFGGQASQAPELSFGQGQAGGNTLGYTRNDVGGMFPQAQVNNVSNPLPYVMPSIPRIPLSPVFSMFRPG